MALAAMNIWTGSPLVALWIGSQLQGMGPPKMSSVAAVVLAMAAISFGLVRLLSYLSHLHDGLTGRTGSVSEHVPWLRSMRGERPLYPGEDSSLTSLERILVIVVVLVVLLFEIWLLFFAGSPLDGRTGRD